MKLIFFILLFCVNVSANVRGLSEVRIGIADECPYYCKSKEQSGYLRDIFDKFFGAQNIHKINYFVLPSFRIIRMVESGELDFGVLSSKDVRYNSKLVSLDTVVGVSYSGVMSLTKDDNLFLSFSDFKGLKVCFINPPVSIEKDYKELQAKSPKNVLALKGKNAVERGFKMLSTGRSKYVVGEYNALKNFKGMHPNYIGKFKIVASSFTGYNSLVFFTSKKNKHFNRLNKSFRQFMLKERKTGTLSKLLKSYYIDDWSQLVTY